ncbi:unnamed protein product [Dovyalis caffra]|uniref:Uncharacterized protein n=1 Tax=Dovyalis caffra TaxID=77055 RepID=A0AAV1RN73_9ROSI|nr:unnamed protein product [Dovyalis caffra]
MPDEDSKRNQKLTVDSLPTKIVEKSACRFVSWNSWNLSLDKIRFIKRAPKDKLMPDEDSERNQKLTVDSIPTKIAEEKSACRFISWNSWNLFLDKMRFIKRAPKDKVTKSINMFDEKNRIRWRSAINGREKKSN